MKKTLILLLICLQLNSQIDYIRTTQNHILEDDFLIFLKSYFSRDEEIAFTFISDDDTYVNNYKQVIKYFKNCNYFKINIEADIDKVIISSKKNIIFISLSNLKLLVQLNLKFKYICSNPLIIFSKVLDFTLPKADIEKQYISLNAFTYNIKNILNSFNMEQYSNLLKLRIGRTKFDYEEVMRTVLKDFHKPGILMNEYLDILNNLNWYSPKNLNKLLNILSEIQNLIIFCKNETLDKINILYGCMGRDDINYINLKFYNLIKPYALTTEEKNKIRVKLFTLNYLYGGGFSEEEINIKKDILQNIIEAQKKEDYVIYDHVFMDDLILFLPNNSHTISHELNAIKEIFCFCDNTPISTILKHDSLISFSEKKIKIMLSKFCDIDCWYFNFLNGLFYIKLKEFEKANYFLLKAKKNYSHWRLDWALYKLNNKLNRDNMGLEFLNLIPKTIRDFILNEEK